MKSTLTILTEGALCSPPGGGISGTGRIEILPENAVAREYNAMTIAMINIIFSLLIIPIK